MLDHVEHLVRTGSNAWIRLPYQLRRLVHDTRGTNPIPILSDRLNIVRELLMNDWPFFRSACEHVQGVRQFAFRNDIKLHMDGCQLTVGSFAEHIRLRIRARGTHAPVRFPLPPRRALSPADASRSCRSRTATPSDTASGSAAAAASSPAAVTPVVFRPPLPPPPAAPAAVSAAIAPPPAAVAAIGPAAVDVSPTEEVVSPCPDDAADATVPRTVSSVTRIVDRSASLLADNVVDPLAWQELVVQARTCGWSELTEIPVDLRGPVHARDMFPPPPAGLPPVSFRYPSNVSSSSSSPASSSSEVSSWDANVVFARLLALDIPALTWIVRVLQFETV